MGLILLNKKAGITSFDALKDIKRAMGTGKVGHTGTLDKFAQGLLVVLTEKDLKLTPWFLHCDKQYVGRIRFGIETDTLDPEGETIAQAPLPLREEVERVLPQFTGEIMQAPPAYSAIHVNGKRASELARAGKAPEMKKRQVTVYKLELRIWQPPFAEIFVHCSSGTYIRCLARDIATAAGSCGHLSSLIRTQIAGFKLEDTESAEMGGNQLLSINKKVISLLGLPFFDVSPADAEKIKHGKALDSIMEKVPPDLHTASLFFAEDLAAVVERQDGKWKYGCVLN